MEQRVSINHSAKCVRVWHGGRNARQTYFSATDHGSLYKAYRAAREFEKNLPPESRVGRVKPRARAMPHSQSGIVGVCPFRNRSGEQAGWRAHWTQDDGDRRKPKTKDFSFSTFGRSAFTRALDHRDDMVGKHYPEIK